MTKLDGVFRWFGNDRRENDRITKEVYVEECAGSRWVGRPRKKWMLEEERFGCQASKENGIFPDNLKANIRFWLFFILVGWVCGPLSKYAVDSLSEC